MMARWIGTGACFLAAAIILGAFGAHGLRGMLDSYSLEIYQKAVFYHALHAIGLLIVPILARLLFISESAASRTCILLAVGVFFFSGSLYLLAITGVKWFGAITPLGGLAFIAGWIFLAYQLFFRVVDEKLTR